MIPKINREKTYILDLVRSRLASPTETPNREYGMMTFRPVRGDMDARKYLAALRANGVGINDSDRVRLGLVALCLMLELEVAEV
jgi:hypothetical protein